ncbi:helix-turn-helix domain-containing protein [Leptospira ellisii]|nr:helix-turn-helix domain-containing protein [Leptospira ellisii]
MEVGELDCYQAMLFLATGCIVWSYSNANCSAEGGLLCSVLELFFVYSSILTALVFHAFRKKMRREDPYESVCDPKDTFKDPLKIGIQSGVVAFFSYWVWRTFLKPFLPDLVVVVSAIVCFYYILILLDILFGTSMNRKEKTYLLPFLTVILTLKGFELVKQIRGISELTPLRILDDCLVLFSPVFLNEMLPSRKKKTNDFAKMIPDDSFAKIKIKEAESKSPYQYRRPEIKQNLLGNVDLAAIEKKLKYLFEVEKVFLDEDLRLPKLADEIGISLHHLSAFVNDHLGTSFSKFVNQYRVREAKRMLVEEPERRVMSVGMAVGFNSASAFHRAFYTETGHSPKSFREMYPIVPIKPKNERGEDTEDKNSEEG